MALLAMGTQYGSVPVPIAWQWPDLCDRMGVRRNGRTTRQIEDALLAIRGLMIVSERAIYDHCFPGLSKS